VCVYLVHLLFSAIGKEINCNYFYGQMFYDCLRLNRSCGCYALGLSINRAGVVVVVVVVVDVDVVGVVVGVSLA